MQKITLSLLSFFIFLFVSIRMTPRNHFTKNSRSIASTEHGPIANKFLTQFEKDYITLSDISQFTNANNKALVEDIGELNADIVEYDPKRAYTIEYFLVDDNGERSAIELVNAPDPKLIGKEVEFSGFDENGKRYGIISKSTSTRGLGIAQQQIEKDTKIHQEKMLLIFFKFDSSPTPHITMQEARNHAYGAYRRFYSDISDRKLQHYIDVSGWHHLNRDENAAGESSVCHVTNQEIKDAIAADGKDPMDYDNISIMSNCDSYSTIGGRATLSKWDWLGIGKNSTYVRMAARSDLYAIGTNPDVPGWTSFTSILVHERGHNFGLRHSNALDCGSHQFLQDCEYIEYGNTFDRMGGPDSTYTFNADQQRLAGWKNEQNDFHHIKESGTYIINRITDEKSDSRKIGAYIYLPGTDEKIMMVEYRQAYKFDNRLQKWIFRNVAKGVHLYSRMGKSSVDKSPHLSNQFRYIDSKPTELDWHQDTAYESLDDSYYDPVSGATIYMKEVVGTKAIIEVVFDSAKQICYKKELKDKVARPFITRYAPIEKLEQKYELSAPALDPGAKPSPTPTKRFIRSKRSPAASVANTIRRSIHMKQKHIVLVPGDDFRVRPESMLADALYCPRSRINFEWTNASQFFNWIKQIANVGSGTITDGDFNLGNGKSGDTRPPGGGNGGPPGPVTSFYNKKIFDNYDQEYQGFPELTVPADALGRNYQMRFKSVDNATGEELIQKVYIYIRAKHNAIITISSDTETK